MAEEVCFFLIYRSVKNIVMRYDVGFKKLHHMAHFAGQSHRAKLPNVIMGKISLPTEELNNRAVRKYRFNAKEGIIIGLNI